MQKRNWKNIMAQTKAENGFFSLKTDLKKDYYYSNYLIVRKTRSTTATQCYLIVAHRRWEWNIHSDYNAKIARFARCCVCYVRSWVFICERHPTQVCISSTEKLFICSPGVWCHNRSENSRQLIITCLACMHCVIPLDSSFVFLVAKNNNRKFASFDSLTHYISVWWTLVDAILIWLHTQNIQQLNRHIRPKMNWNFSIFAFFFLSLTLRPIELYFNFFLFVHLSAASICIRSANHAYHLHFVLHLAHSISHSIT